ncbi:hypothetical protein LguiA_004368 [Lonicera macranthoides]
MKIYDWLDKLLSIVHSMSLASETVTDWGLVNHILSSAGPMYETTIAGVLSRDKPINYLSFEALLLGAECRLQHSMLPVDTGSTVLTVSRGTGGRNGSSGDRNSRHSSGDNGYSGGGQRSIDGPSGGTFSRSNGSRRGGGGSYFGGIPYSGGVAVLGPPPSQPSGNVSMIHCFQCWGFGQKAMDCLTHVPIPFYFSGPPTQLTAYSTQRQVSSAQMCP